MVDDAIDARFILGVDLDGVVADWNAGFKPIAAEFLGVDADSLPPPHSWELTEWGFDKDSLHDVFEVAVAAKRMYRDLPVYPHASEVLHRLSDAGVHIRIVTHRLVLTGAHQATASDTVAWLDDNDIPYWDLCFLGRKSDLSVDLLIDDAPHNIASLRRTGQNVLVMDQLYNRHLGGPRAHGWLEVEQYVMSVLPPDLPRLPLELHLPEETREA